MRLVSFADGLVLAGSHGLGHFGKRNVTGLLRHRAQLVERLQQPFGIVGWTCVAEGPSNDGLHVVS